ncbi:LysR family transcriptional regulator [uncultured Tolumonas sp.]|uniref:LysR family transcriptional regulator n=1 Tax=uncultured Tolumonas sp. TaxID=263765 RepID=UPI002A0A64A1|nr:LysR family transcriptional regulator [uncultured Tolumonas sp.]
MAENSPETLFSANTPDRLELLRTFVRIVEAGSLSAAATQLNSTQPTISRRLKTLEQLFGVRLLHRSTHHLRLSEAGERCYAGAKQFLAQWDIFASDLTGVDREPEGLLRIIAPHAFGQDVLVDPLAEFMQLHPRVTVEWLLHDDRSIRDFIAEGIDCAIQVGEVLDPAMVRIRLAEIPRILVGAPALFTDRPLPQHPDDLKTLPWLALQTFYRNQITLRHVTGQPQIQLPLTPIFSTDSLYALRSASVRGLGIGIGSSWLMNQDIAEGKLLRLLPDWEAEPLPVYLVYPYAKYYPAKLRLFIELMRKNMPSIINALTSLKSL